MDIIVFLNMAPSNFKEDTDVSEVHSGYIFSVILPCTHKMQAINSSKKMRACLHGYIASYP
jgi:hypothetical protein